MGGRRLAEGCSQCGEGLPAGIQTVFRSFPSGVIARDGDCHGVWEGQQRRSAPPCLKSGLFPGTKEVWDTVGRENNVNKFIHRHFALLSSGPN